MKKVEDYGQSAMDLCIKLYGQGMSYDSICSELNMKFNADLTLKQIEHFFGRSKNKIVKILSEDKNLQTKLANTYIDSGGQLKEVNSELWKFFYELRKNPESAQKMFICPKCKFRFKERIKSYNTLLKISQEILEQIKHQDKLLGRLRNQSFNIKISYTDLSKKIALIFPKMLKDLERRKIIRILSKKRFKDLGEKQEINLEFDQEKEMEGEEDEERITEEI